MLSKYSFIQTFLLYLYRPIFMSFHFTISLCIYLNIQLLPPNANLKLLNPLHRKILFLYLMIFTITKLTLYYCASIIIPYTEYSYPFTSKDNIIVIVTFPPCLQRGCQDLINEYKKICKRIRIFCIGDYNTGTIIEC